MEEISCPICGSIDYKVIFKTKDFRLKTSADTFEVIRCDSCLFKFLNPQPKVEEIGNCYSADFYKVGKSFYDRLLQSFFSFAQKIQINKVFKRYKKNGVILDVGCGSGSFMLAMQNNGYDAWGVEPDLRAKRYSPDSIIRRIFYKNLEDCGFPEKRFDIITMFQSMEHVANTGSLLSEIRHILKDDGILYICVPNTDFFEYRLFGKYYYNLEIPRHLYFFTQDSLEALLSKNGFRIEKILPKSVFELILTPAAFYYSVWNFLEEKTGFSSRAVRYLSIPPLIIMRFLAALFFIFEKQDLEVICRLTTGNSKRYA